MLRAFVSFWSLNVEFHDNRKLCYSFGYFQVREVEELIPPASFLFVQYSLLDDIVSQ